MYNLPIGSMVQGDSFFVPCLDDTDIRKELTQLAHDFKFNLRIEKVLYNGMYGVRVWRI
jgi:hypothetical protein